MSQKDDSKKKYFRKHKIKQDHATRGNSKRWKEDDPWLGWPEGDYLNHLRRQELRQAGVVEQE